MNARAHERARRQSLGASVWSGQPASVAGLRLVRRRGQSIVPQLANLGDGGAMALVLVIDDDPLFREIAREVLVQAGHEVLEAENGAKAAKIDAAPPPRLAVVDMLMPERDGIETIRDLRARWPGMKLVAVTAGARGLEPDLLLRAAKVMGADAVLQKPIDHHALLGLIDRLLG